MIEYPVAKTWESTRILEWQDLPNHGHVVIYQSIVVDKAGQRWAITTKETHEWKEDGTGTMRYDWTTVDRL